MTSSTKNRRIFNKHIKEAKVTIELQAGDGLLSYGYSGNNSSELLDIIYLSDATATITATRMRDYNKVEIVNVSIDYGGIIKAIELDDHLKDYSQVNLEFHHLESGDRILREGKVIFSVQDLMSQV